MKQFCNWLIRKLGGVTADDHEAFRVQCRDFAERYWEEGDYLLRTDERLIGAQAEGAIQQAIIIGDRVVVRDIVAVIPQVAPWCKWAMLAAVYFPSGVYQIGARGP